MVMEVRQSVPSAGAIHSSVGIENAIAQAQFEDTAGVLRPAETARQQFTPQTLDFVLVQIADRIAQLPRGARGRGFRPWRASSSRICG